MDIQSRIAIFQFFLGLALLGFAWALYRRTKTDRYREDLFTIRDDLFDYMWKNQVDFDLPAYRLMRQMLNGAIRAAGDISPWSFITVVVLVQRQRAQTDRLAVALEEVRDEAVRAHLYGVREKFVFRFAKFVFAEGILGLLVACVHGITATPKRVREVLHRWAGQWDEPLVVWGSPNPHGAMSREPRP